MKKSRRSIFTGALIILILILGFFALSSHKKAPPPKPAPAQQTSLPQQKTASAPEITLKVGNTDTQIALHSGETLYDALMAARKNGAVSFSGANYPGLGYFVTDIGTLHQGNGKYLIYYINGTEASVGVSTYIPKDGDAVEWKLQ